MKIRDFQFPQTFCSLEPFTNSLKYVLRNLKDIFECGLEIDRDAFLSESEKPVTVKIQKAKHISGNDFPTNREVLLDRIQKQKIIRVCKLSTVARFMLDSDLHCLPNHILHSNYIIAITVDGLLKISISNKSVQREFDGINIDPETPILLETDSI